MNWKLVRTWYKSKLSAVRTPTVGASPYTYQNTSGADEDAVVNTGTVSAVAVSRDNTTFYTVAAATNTGKIRLCHGDYIKITYSVAPALIIFPS